MTIHYIVVEGDICRGDWMIIVYGVLITLFYISYFTYLLILNKDLFYYF